MDPQIQRRSLIAFYFGTKVATANVTSEQAIHGVARRAYADLQRTLRGFGTHQSRSELKRSTIASIQSFVDNLATIDSQASFDAQHDHWCRTTCDKFAHHEHGSRPFSFHYGQAQKWLNMTLKYLAVLDHPDVQRLYPYLHVPVDQYVYKEAASAGVTRPVAPNAWSTLTSEKYIDYQHRLRQMVESTGKYTCPLDWEAAVWIDRTSTTTP